MRLVPEMTFTETIAGPWGPTTGSPFGARLCWQVTEAALAGDRIRAHLVMPGADWIRLGPDGIRRQDQRITFGTDDGAIVMLRYDAGIIRENEIFINALRDGTATAYTDQHMRMVAEFDTGDPRYAWLTQHLFVGEGRLAGDRRIEYRIHRVD
ncbi:MAG: DUF3237 domain-containing protein [Streptosporangiaceae bacterium]